jgi:hypothetical protein
MQGVHRLVERSGGPASSRSRDRRRSRAARRQLAIMLLLVTVLVAGLSTTLPVRSVEAAPFPVTVRLTIEDVEAIGDVDGACGEADFFVNVAVNGVTGTKGPIDGNDHITPSDWVFDGPATHDTGVSVPITIDLKDDDDTFCLGDDDIDINPGGGVGLSISVNLGNVPCTISGDTSGTCGLPINVQGNGGGDGSAKMRFRVDVFSALPDADGDGLADDWEQNGVSFNGQFIDLPAMGADKNKPDIFIQIDWMQNTTNDQRLTDNAIQRVVDAFANSPYVSPTGSVGINMHIDQGSGSDLHRGSLPTTTWGGLSRAQSIPLQMNLGQADASGNYIWTEFDAIKQTNFVPTGRSPIFHYVIAAFLLEPPPPGGTQTTSSGISRNNDGSKFFDGASDFIISLGGTGGAGTEQQQAGTLMHELGHNLGLGHGGNEGTNYKPNYISIMNYFFQMRGLDVGAATGVLDYSRGALPALNEGMLDETNGLGSAAAGRGTAHLCSLASAATLDRRFITNANGPINWSCETPPVISPGTVSFDASGNGMIDASLTGFDDWANIKFTGGQIGALGATVLPMVTPSEPAIPLDTVPPTVTAVVTPAANAAGWHKTPVTVTLTAVDNPGGDGVWDITHSATGAGVLPSTTTAGDTVTFVISAEGITTVTFHARDRSGNVSAAKTSTIRIDMTKPVVSLTCPTTVILNTVGATAPWTASDALSGLATPASGTVALDASTPGAHTATTPIAKDLADNTNMASCTYYVVYKFSGFFAPIDNLPAINDATGGQGIPIRWRITDVNDVPITDPTSFVSVTVTSLSCSSSTTTDAIEEYATGGSGLRKLGNGDWQFNWATLKNYRNSCKTMKLNLKDTIGMTDAQLAAIGRTAAFRFR